MTEAVESKICKKCDEVRLFSDFSVDKNRSDGLRSNCRACIKLATAAYRVAHRDQLKAASADWAKANPEKVKANGSVWRAQNKEKSKATYDAYYAAHKGKICAANSAWAAANPVKKRDAAAAWGVAKKDQIKARKLAYNIANKDQRSKASKAWSDAHPGAVSARTKAWRRSHPEARRAHGQSRRARKLHATPGWDLELTNFACLEAADLCVKRCDSGLGAWHIDHTIPLLGREVCGLHVWNNLAVVPAKFNLVKGNRILDSHTERSWL